VEGNIYFAEDLREDEEFGAVISGARWTAINEQRFLPVYEWLKSGEYSPRLEGDALEGILDDSQYRKEMERCGYIFDLARQLLLWKLVDLVTLKFEVLCSHFSRLEEKPVLQIMPVIRLVHAEPSSETDGETRMRDLLVELVAGHFWDMVAEQPSNTQHILARFPEFHAAVLERMTMIVREKHGLSVAVVEDEDEGSRAVSMEE
jgi:hypothetical protein